MLFLKPCYFGCFLIVISNGFSKQKKRLYHDPHTDIEQTCLTGLRANEETRQFFISKPGDKSKNPTFIWSKGMFNEAQMRMGVAL